MNHKNVPLGPPGDPLEAFRQLVYSYEPNVATLAQKMGMKPGVLYNKADADSDSHHQPTLANVIVATQVTGDYRVLDALNEMFGRAAFDVSPCTNLSDEALLELMLRLGKEMGEFHSVVRSALLDRNFNRPSLALIRAEAFDTVSALMTLVSRLEGLLDE